MKTKIKKSLLILALATLMAIALTSCTQPFSHPELSYRDIEGGGKVPQVSGFVGSENINKKLTDIFSPYASYAYTAVSDSNGELKVEYTLEKQKSVNIFSPEYRISMLMSNSNGSNLTVASALLSGLSKLSVEGVSDSDVSWLGSSEAIMTSLKLNEMGLEMSPSQVIQKTIYQFALEMFIKTYEDVTGKPVDIEGIKVGASNGVTYQKAMALEFITYYFETEDFKYPDDYSFWDELDMTKKLLIHTMNDRYGVHSDEIDGEDLADLIKLYVNIIAVDPSHTQKWNEFADLDMASIAENAGMSETKITRRDAAELIWKINQKSPAFGVKFNDNNLISIDLCDNLWGRRALTYNFMNFYGDSTIFAEQENMSYVNAVQNAQTFIYSKVTNMRETSEYILSNASYNKGNKYSITLQIDLIMQYLKNWEKKYGSESYDVTEIINDRDYSWYYSQSNTGPYSSVNCMPSIATMAAHWYNKDSKATVRKMRNTSDITEGWTVYELRNGLSAYDIPYTSAEASLGNIIDALDNGKIVLAQYSDRPFNLSGHCYVIYGYRKYKNTVIFIINDSDSLTDRSLLYGRPAGCGNEIDADFSMWSIERFVSDITIVG